MTIKLTLYHRIFFGIHTNDLLLFDRTTNYGLYHSPIDAYEFYALLPAIYLEGFTVTRSPRYYFFLDKDPVFSMNLKILNPEELTLL